MKDSSIVFHFLIKNEQFHFHRSTISFIGHQAKNKTIYFSRKRQEKIKPTENYFGQEGFLSYLVLLFLRYLSIL